MIHSVVDPSMNLVDPNFALGEAQKVESEDVEARLCTEPEKLLYSRSELLIMRCQ